MKLSNPKKWYIKDAPPNVNMVKHLPLSLNFPDKPLFQEVLFTPNDLQTVCSSRTSKKKPSKLTNSKQPRPPSAEITQRNPNPHTPNQNQLSFSLKSKLKPSLYNNISITSPKIKSKPQNTFSLTQKSFHPQNHQKPSTKAKTLNEMPTDGLFEQSSKSTQCINESSKSIQLLNETFLTVKAENPENSVKNIPFISPVNNMMRRLTFNEKERDILSTNTIMTSEEKPILNNKENLPTTKEEDIVLPEPKKISIRSFSQNSRVPSNETSLHTKTQTPSARNKGQPNSPKNENDETLTFAIRSKTNIQASSSEKQKDEINALQKITDLVKEINDLENQGGDYHQMRTCVLALEEKLTDLKSSIELKRPHHHIFKKQIPFNSPENKENKQSFVKEIPHIASTHIVASENILNSIVTSARPFVKDETKEKEGIISIIQVQSLLNSKHKYPKSTTNADVKKKKFAFQNKPASIKLQTLNPQEELIPEEPQGINSIIPKHSSIALVSSLEDEIQPMNNRTYYISNTVNAFYKPLNIYSDGCQDNYFTQLCQEHMIQTFQSLHLSRNLFDNIENHCFKEKYIELPKKESHKYMKTLIFDLDETLVHCNENLELPADVILPIKFPNGQKIEVIF